MKNADQSAYPSTSLCDRSLTKREVFAKAAMEALISTQKPQHPDGSTNGQIEYNDWDVNRIVSYAITFADQMLEKLEKTK